MGTITLGFQIFILDGIFLGKLFFFKMSIERNSDKFVVQIQAIVHLQLTLKKEKFLISLSICMIISFHFKLTSHYQ